MAATAHRIDVPGLGEVNARHDAASRPRATFVLPPRYRVGRHDSFGEHLAGLLPLMGIELWRFEFPGPEHARDLPPVDVQQRVWRAVIPHIKQPGRPLAVGAVGEAGRPLSQLVAQGETVDGLALFSYPVHSYDHPKQRRTAHFPNIAVPTLLCSSNHDLQALPYVVHEAAALIANATVSIIEITRWWEHDQFDRGAAVALIDFIDALPAAVP